MTFSFRTAISLAGLAFIGTLPVAAGNVPAELPDPDGKPGDATKPVKVYILAGQSNMVGMGNLSGAQNVYDGFYLSSDPAVPEGPFQISGTWSGTTTALALRNLSRRRRVPVIVK